MSIHFARGVVITAIMLGLAGAAGAADLEFANKKADGTETKADTNSALSDISADGRFVAFVTTDTTIDPGDPFADYDIYVRDRVLGTLHWVTNQLATDFIIETRGIALSGDGKVLYHGFRRTVMPYYGIVRTQLDPDDNGLIDAITSSVVWATSFYDPFYPRTDHDGSTVVFVRPTQSTIPGAGAPYGVYALDVASGAVQHLSTHLDGSTDYKDSSYPIVSGDGRWVVYRTFDPKVAGAPIAMFSAVIMLHDLVTGQRQHTPFFAAGLLGCDLSFDGRYLVGLGTYPVYDGIFVLDRDSDGNGAFDEPGTETKDLVSVTSQGTSKPQFWNAPGNISMDYSGRFVTYYAPESNVTGSWPNSGGNNVLFDRMTRAATRLNLNDTGEPVAHFPFGVTLAKGGTAVLAAAGLNGIEPGATYNAADQWSADLYVASDFNTEWITNYGKGCTGQFPWMLAPLELLMDGEPRSSGYLSMRVVCFDAFNPGIVTGYSTPVFALIGTSAVQVPIGSGCSVLAWGAAPALIPLPTLSVSVPWSYLNATGLSGFLPANLPPTTLHIQAFAYNGGAFAASNAVRVDLQP